ncbi:potassium channel family protein [Psychroflexus gondwanensis]|uniref:Ion transporter, ion-trans 2 superfamily protein n=1 Tax=Psychroflexus gondwanensis ACAM 44 TaxID=1189619 RepID=N1WYA0_9FLAO|nr:potassium channel family protein [Psychroflexus gondwanensis]EMY82074.1 ion transporter, ion-trans 2 superfamily protein [Psychroflexus gondwanensis ACAM 44]TXE20186.1 potassium channel family protein [Psychroflexus gondwanensis]
MLSVSNLIIALLSIFSIALLSLTFFLDQNSELYRLIHYYDFGLCMVFLYDFFNQLRKRKKRWRYFFTYGWLDLLSSIPVVSEFRYIRVLRIFRIFRIMKSFHLLYQFIITHKKASLYGFIVFVSTVILVLSSTLVLYLEKDVGNIKTAEDALWWSYITITTVGYGDYYPVTGLGKLAASILILNGIAIFGAIVSYITDRVNTIKRKSSLD